MLSILITERLLPLPDWIQFWKTYVAERNEMSDSFTTKQWVVIPWEFCEVIWQINDSDSYTEERTNVVEHTPVIQPSTNITKEDKKVVMLESLKSFKEKFRWQMKEENVFRELFWNEMWHEIEKFLK